jgi:hypothetical protein
LGGRIEIRGPKQSRIVQFDCSRSLRFGRDLNADVVLHDAKASRLHFRVDFLEGGVVRLLDEGARNGTRVNGQLVRECFLTDGARVLVGDTELVFHLHVHDAGPTPSVPTQAATEMATLPPTENGFQELRPRHVQVLPPAVTMRMPAVSQTEAAPRPPVPPSHGSRPNPSSWGAGTPSGSGPGFATEDLAVPGFELEVPGYVLEQRLCTRAYGEVQCAVYAARQEQTGAQVVVKVLLAAKPKVDQVALFARAARVWSAVRHPHVVALMHDGTAAQLPFISLEYCPRGSLDQTLRALRGSRLAPLEALRIFVQIASALAELERQGIVHRAVQPSNILLGEKVYKLSDLLVAKPASKGILPAHLLETNEWLVRGGSLYYMAPERFLHTLDPRSDVYSLGITFYELLTGRLPFVDLMAKHANQLSQLGSALLGAPRPPAPDFTGLPPGVDALLLRCMHPDYEQRCGASELVAELGRMTRLQA